MAIERPHSQRLATVEKAFNSLPERYLGADSGFDAIYHIKLCDLGHTWDVRCTELAARVRKGATRRAPDVIVTTDSDTWMGMREGRFSGVDAFHRGALRVRGNLDHAIAFEGLFRLVGGRRPLLRIRDVRVGRHRVSTLTMGHGPDVLLLHGLGGTRASLLQTAASLSRSYTVHAPDLPGFGSSCKPALGAYNAGWFAEIMLGLLEELGVGQAHLVGNSMGGRVAIEMGLIAPERVSALALLCPAVAWIKRGLHPLVRLLRPEFGLLPHGFRRSTVASYFWSFFCDRDALDPAIVELMVDEFRRIYQTAGARYAFLSSARNIYLEPPFGRCGFYPRLAALAPPALFVWGSHDSLIPPAFGRHVGRWLPSAEQVTIDACGHVPQVERPEETGELLMRFFTRAEQPRETERTAAWAATPAVQRHPRRRRRSRLTAPGPTDLDERDPDFIRERLPGLWLLASIWFRAEVRGLGNIPDSGPVLLVGNHSRAGMTPETIVFTLAFSTYFGVERPFYHLARNVAPASSFGAVAPSQVNARRALARGAALLVHPGGDHERHRSTSRPNRVDCGHHTAFLRLALDQRVPLVPVVSIGGHDTALFLSLGERFARWLALDRLPHSRVVPITLPLPWGLGVGEMLRHIPLPAKITIETLPPIDVRGQFGPDPDLDYVYDHVARLMQDTLDALASERRLPVIG